MPKVVLSWLMDCGLLGLSLAVLLPALPALLQRLPSGDQLLALPGWLAATPLGVKLVPPLAGVYAALLGHALQLSLQVLHLAHLLVADLFPKHLGCYWHWALLPLGLSNVLRGLAMALRAVTLHLQLSAHVARRLLAAQVQLLWSLALLFAGQYLGSNFAELELFLVFDNI